MAKRLTPEQQYLRTITEDAWRNVVVETARHYGWIATFIPDRFHAAARVQGFMRYTNMGDVGAPDLLLVGPRSILHVELKRETGKLDPPQEVWRDRIIAAGGEWYLWRPSHRDEVIQRLEEG